MHPLRVTAVVRTVDIGDEMFNAGSSDAGKGNSNDHGRIQACPLGELRFRLRARNEAVAAFCLGRPLNAKRHSSAQLTRKFEEFGARARLKLKFDLTERMVDSVRSDLANIESTHNFCVVDLERPDPSRHLCHKDRLEFSIGTLRFKQRT